MANGPDNYEARGTYKGPIPMLKGYVADLIIYRSTGRCMAMFDNPESGYAGWFDFNTEHFDIEGETNGPA